MCALLTEAAELAYDVGQGYVSHTLQLILDVPWQHRVAQVPGLDGALYQRHPSAATPLPAGVRWRETGQREWGRGGEQNKTSSVEIFLRCRLLTTTLISTETKEKETDRKDKTLVSMIALLIQHQNNGEFY